MAFDADSGPVTASTTLITDQERERFHRQILSSVSHDLKTPLASIIGSLEVYERMNARLSPEQRETLIGVALQETYRLDNFITNILDMAKLENGLVKLREERISLNALLEDCVTRLGRRLKGSQVQIENPQGFPQITIDPALLTRAVCLVLDNAVKYGGAPPAIHITYDNTDGFGSVHIKDNGPGVPDGKLETIFSKYTRFARGDQQNAGTGLGLAISREIMRLLKGTITAANGSQGGAVFTLRFPIVEA
jgi:two-component system sensor histidine kinase KdpD